VTGGRARRRRSGEGVGIRNARSQAMRRELAAAVTLAGDDEHGDPFDQSVQQVECGSIGNQRGAYAGELKLRTEAFSVHDRGCPRRRRNRCVAKRRILTRSAWLEWLRQCLRRPGWACRRGPAGYALAGNLLQSRALLFGSGECLSGRVAPFLGSCCSWSACWELLACLPELLLGI
jgi:hypothetical protein